MRSRGRAPVEPGRRTRTDVPYLLPRIGTYLERCLGCPWCSWHRVLVVLRTRSLEVSVAHGRIPAQPLTKAPWSIPSWLDDQSLRADVVGTRGALTASTRRRWLRIGPTT